jgi:hypothetical protein
MRAAVVNQVRGNDGMSGSPQLLDDSSRPASWLPDSFRELFDGEEGADGDFWCFVKVVATLGEGMAL